MIARWHCPSCARSWWRLSLWPGRCRACGDRLVREAPPAPAAPPPFVPPPAARRPERPARRIDRLPGGPALREGITVWDTSIQTAPNDWFYSYEIELPTGERVGLGRREQLAGLIVPLASPREALEYVRYLYSAAVPGFFQQSPSLVELSERFMLHMHCYAIEGLDPARPLVSVRELEPEGELRRFEIVRPMIAAADLGDVRMAPTPLTSALRVTETVRADGQYRIETRPAVARAKGGDAHRADPGEALLDGATLRLTGIAQRGRPLEAGGRPVVARLRAGGGWG